LIVYQRWIRGSDQNGEFLVGETNRRKEARGMCKSNFISHLEMLITHQYPFDDFETDEENFSVALSDELGIFYYTKFYIIERI
jgi:hypothetical protein